MTADNLDAFGIRGAMAQLLYSPKTSWTAPNATGGDPASTERALGLPEAIFSSYNVGTWISWIPA